MSPIYLGHFDCNCTVLRVCARTISTRLSWCEMLFTQPFFVCVSFCAAFWCRCCCCRIWFVFNWFDYWWTVLIYDSYSTTAIFCTLNAANSLKWSREKKAGTKMSIVNTQHKPWSLPPLATVVKKKSVQQHVVQYTHYGLNSLHFWMRIFLHKLDNFVSVFFILTQFLLLLGRRCCCVCRFSWAN